MKSVESKGYPRRDRRWWQWAMVFAFVFVSWQLHSQSPVAELAGTPSPGLHVLVSSEQSIVLELRVPAWEVGVRQAGTLQLDEIAVPGFSHTTAPGAPRLPVRFVTLGIPPEVDPQIQVLEVDGPQIEAGYRLAANPAPALRFDPEARPALTELTAPPEPQVEPARGAAFYPAELAQIVQVGRLRSQPFVQIRLQPFQYHPEKQMLRIYQRVQVAVTFGMPASEVQSGPVDEGPFEPVLRSLLFNYADAKDWRSPPHLSVGARGAGSTEVQRQRSREASASAPPLRVRVEVSQDGLYELDRDLLQDTAIGDYSLSTFQLFEDFNLSPSSEVALEIVDQNGDDRLDTGDAIRFYGRGPAEEKQRYTDTRVYWLVAGREPGRRMAMRSAPPEGGAVPDDFPTTVHVEENHEYWSNLPGLGGSDTHWYWAYLTHTDPDAPLVRDYTVSTPGVSSVGHTVALRAKLVGYPVVEPDHRTTLSLNGNLVVDTVWSGQKGVVIEGGTASSGLNSDANTIGLGIELLPNIAADSLFIDWFEIDYRRAFKAQNDRLIFTRLADYAEYQVAGFSEMPVGVYDITDPLQPARLTEVSTDGTGTLRFRDATPAAQQYMVWGLEAPAILAPDRVVQEEAGADLRAPANGAQYVIITHADFTEAAERLADHRAGDFSVRVVQVQDVYNQFGNGTVDPEAIHDFLAYAVDNWVPRPQYVVLLGDGTYDYRNYLNKPRKNYIPPYQAMVDPWIGETADENYYAAVSGPDIMPDLFLGRLPVNTQDEANAVVDKIISYETGAGQQAGQTASGSALFVTDDVDPEAGDFPRLSDAIVDATLPGSFTVQRVYYKETHPDPGSANSAIIDYINQGQQFVNYIGHAGIKQWADERLFVSADVDTLNNTDKLPVVLGMTCLEGAFQSISQDALAERMVRAENRGAVASWSATGFGVATGHDDLNRGFYNALFRDGVRRLGPATVAGKTQLYNSGMHLDLIHTFVLLGDPALDTGIVGNSSPQADITGDGRVDVEDLAALAPYWRQFKGAPYDQDGNGYINVADFARVAAAWNSTCPELQADITGDGRVDVEDLAALAPYWRQFKGAPYDQDGNGYINVVDFARVAAAWNSTCNGS